MPGAAADRTGAAGSPDVDVYEGDVVGDKFRVDRVIGEGGMGFVVAATHLQLDERVALKFLHKRVRSDADIVSRFKQEARAAVRLKSEHVARVIDVGVRSDGAPFMVMEYLEGQDLGRILAGGETLPLADAVEYLIQACEAVGEAHARGIVHRDLKPDNLFRVERPDGWKLIKVLDFGISKVALTGAVGDMDLSSHKTASLMGSPHYMSPEQLRSTATVDHRADIWSLGTTLFEMVTGRTAFSDAKNVTELVAEILEQPHRRLRLFRSDAPVGLERVVDRCLAKDRVQRYASAAELAIALLPYTHRRARTSAERSASVARAAGMLSDPNLSVSTVPEAKFDEAVPPRVPPAPRVPVDRGDMAYRTTTAAISGRLPSSESAVSSPGPHGGEASTGRWRTVAAASALASLALGAFLLSVVARGPRSSPAPAGLSESSAGASFASTGVAAEVPPLPSAAPSSSGSVTPVALAPPVASVVPPGDLTGRALVRRGAPPASSARSSGPRAPASAAAAPTASELDIRRER